MLDISYEPELLIFKYVNGRKYIHNSEFLDCLFSKHQDADSCDIHCHKIAKDSAYVLYYSKTSEFTAAEGYVATGRIDNLNFGFLPISRSDCLGSPIEKNETRDLSQVKRSTLPWDCTSYLKRQCEGHYHKASSR